MHLCNRMARDLTAFGARGGERCERQCSCGHFFDAELVQLRIRVSSWDPLTKLSITVMRSASLRVLDEC